MKPNTIEKKLAFYESRLERLQDVNTENIKNKEIQEYVSLKNYLEEKISFYKVHLNHLYTSNSIEINVNDYQIV
ncbi:hypothetical protein [Aquimarina litoralis]|uniref:hypothetical protein n=1 Tax=Aquimarina litoralis TaxID=584605 RepID=UPI001C5A58EE|nr:hypothetical protein [Aquimarina litoralis]MBW1296423.1 hypothetical protein [Aquimarina litoralis]